MLKSITRTQEETKKYMEELKSWLNEVKNEPTEEMTAFFAKRIKEYNGIHLENWPNEYAHIADFFEDDLNSLLDIGCGTGLELDAIYKRFPNVKVTGIDLSKTMLDKLREKYSNTDIEIICADYFQYPFEENKYDAALSFETLHHFKFDKI